MKIVREQVQIPILDQILDNVFKEVENPILDECMDHVWAEVSRRHWAQCGRQVVNVL